MELFKLLGTVAIESSAALREIDRIIESAETIGQGFKDGEAASKRSLAEIAAANGKTVDQIEAEAEKIAEEYRKNGMDASTAMKKAYADIGYVAEKTHDNIDKEQDETAERAKNTQKKVSSEAKKTGDNIDKELDDTAEHAEDTQKKVSSTFAKMGKNIAKGLAVASAAVSALLVKSLSLAGDLEQNLGGSEAVFGEYAAKMQETANEAFSNMGLSASDFLATANKMGSLFKGAGFDVKTASDLTAKAMQRAADVASIMGIDVSVAMESIAGAAKGNFVMLDNLGVATTDVTLAEYALAKGIEKSVYTMTVQEKVSLAMQRFLEKTADYTGNYAKENKTLAGSLTTLKAAFKNFLSGSGDAETLASSLVSSGEVIAEKIEALIPSLISGISTLLEKLVPKIPALISRVLPTIINGVIGLVKSILGERVSALVSDLFKFIGRIFDTLANNKSLWEAVREFIDSVLVLLEELAPLLMDITEDILPTICDVLEIVLSVLSPVIDLISKAIHAFRDFYNAKTVDAVYELSDAEREAANSIRETTEAYEDMCLEFAKNAATIEQEAKHAEKLWEELQTLADESGNVKEADQERAKYILGELSEATGKEWEMIDGTIQRYEDMKNEIIELIELKKAEKLLEHGGDIYETALTEVNDRLDARADAEGSYNKQVEALNSAQKELDSWISGFSAEQQQVFRNMLAGEESDAKIAATIDSTHYDVFNDYIRGIEDANIALATREKELREAEKNVTQAYYDIEKFERAEAALAEGNTDLVIELMTETSAARWESLAERKAISEEDRKLMEDDIKKAKSNLAFLSEQYKKGVAGINAEVLQDARDTVAALEKVYAETFGMAEESGKNIVLGLQRGIVSNAPMLYESTRTLAHKTLRTFTEVAQIASPSKVTTQYGRYLVEGLVRGMGETAGDAEAEAANVMDGTLGALAASNIENRAALSSVASEIASSTGASGDDRSMRAMFEDFVSNLPDMLMDAFTSMKFDVNNREFARMVKAVNH